MNINNKKLESILRLSGVERYSHFIKVAADQRKVWGLWSDGWAMASTGDGVQTFPIWPADIYAKRCALDKWHCYDAREIDLSKLLDELLPAFKKSGIRIGVFPTPESQAVTPDLKQFEMDLKQELSRIE